MKKIPVTLLTLICLITISCKKDNDPEPDIVSQNDDNSQSDTSTVPTDTTTDPVIVIDDTKSLIKISNMNFTHERAQSHVLDNGKVIVFGSGTYQNYSKTAEVFDPSTKKWSVTGSMNMNRGNFCSAKLPNGNILAIGGEYERYEPLKSCEIYDVNTGIWSYTADMSVPRSHFQCVALSDGRILVGGDISPKAKITEIYDPKTNTWSVVDTMNISRENFTMTLLDDGTVLAVGGDTQNGTIDLIGSTAEIYNPVADEWTLLDNNATELRASHTAIKLQDGKVLIIGAGVLFFSENKTAELYDPVAQTFTKTGDLAEPKDLSLPILLSDGRVLVSGEGNIFSSTTNFIEVYDPSTDEWSNGGYVTTVGGARDYNIERISNNEILLFGGATFTGKTTTTYIIEE